MSFNRFEVFDAETLSWDRYVKRLRNFLLATKVEEKLMVPTIITLLGDKTYAVLCDLFAPEDPDLKKPEELLDKLSEHFSPKFLIPVERFHFSGRKQKKEESIADFILELKKLSKNCNYGSSLDDRICEQFVYGLVDPEIRTRLLFEETLTLELAIKLASSVESAKKGASTFGLSNSVEGIWSVKKDVQFRNTNVKRPEPSQVNKPCKHCGNNTHLESNCRFKDYICNHCNKKGHLVKVCRSRLSNVNKRHFQNGRKQEYRKADVIKNFSTEIDEGNVTEYDFYRADVNSTSFVNDQPIMIEIFVNKQNIVFEIDSGAGVSLISKELYLQKFSQCELLTTNILLNTIKEQIKPLGKINVSASLNNITMNSLELFVINQLPTPLLGRSWISKFKILSLNVQKPINLITINNKKTMELEIMLHKYAKLFSPTLGELKGFEAHLTLHNDATPRFFKYRPIPFALRPAIELELEKLQKQGILVPIQHSKWAAPVVPILKKDNSIRLCGDYKVGVNPVLVKDSYPLPRIEDIFSKLNGGIIFSKLDMTQAYQQLRMDEESQLILTINTHKGLFKVTRMPFGISTAPSIFQRMMDQLLVDIEGVVCYLDDILVTGKSHSEHLLNLNKVLTRLMDAGITLNKQKCEFQKPSVEYLGHSIDAKGLHTTQTKISDILQAPPPKNISTLRSFLGLINYYRKFLPNLASTLAPLNRLLQKDIKWTWDTTEDLAFKKIKDEIASPRVLVYLDPTLPITLACDASPTGLGAVISHSYPDGTDRPIAFASRSLAPAERNYSQLDKEALGIIFGVKKFHQYLFGRPFTLLTDHKPLTRILAPNAQIPTLATARLQRWSLILSAYDYVINYRASTSHLNADALSRSPMPSIKTISPEETPKDLFTLSQIEDLPITAKDIARETTKDPILSLALKQTQDGWEDQCPQDNLKAYFLRKSELSTLQNCLLWGQRVIIPATLQDKLLDELHRDHVGIVRMKMIARSYFWWPGLDKAIEAKAQTCKECTLHVNLPAKAPPHPWTRPDKPWDRLHIDFAGPFMGHNFLVVVDAHSKWPEIAILNSTTTEKTMTTLHNLWARYGLPLQIVSDNGTQFTSKEFDLFCRKYGIKHTFSPPYHPATNGQAERFVQTLKKFLKKKSKDKTSIVEKINQLLFSYRSTTNISTHQTPALLFLGRELRTRLNLLKPVIKTPEWYTPQINQTRQLQVGQNVIARNYMGTQRWLKGIILQRNGPLTYTVKLTDGKLWKRHIDQLRPLKHKEKGEETIQVTKHPTLPIPLSTQPKPRPVPTPQVEPHTPSTPPVPTPQVEPHTPSTPPHGYPSRTRHPPKRWSPPTHTK